VIIDVKMKMQGSLGSHFCRGRRGRGRMVFGFITTCKISATNVEFESRLGEVYSIKHYMIKFVSDLRRVGGFLRVLQFSPIKIAIKDHHPLFLHS
jgi:hypothetical protein